MYLSGRNGTVNVLLSLGGNYVIWSAHLGSHRYTGQNLAEWTEIKSYYVIMRETLVHKSIYDHLTRMTTVDEIINANASKVPWEGKQLTLMLAAVATQMQHECIKGALAYQIPWLNRCIAVFPCEKSGARFPAESKQCFTKLICVLNYVAWHSHYYDRRLAG